MTDDADVYDYPNWFDDEMHFHRDVWTHGVVELSCVAQNVRDVQDGGQIGFPSN